MNTDKCIVREFMTKEMIPGTDILTNPTSYRETTYIITAHPGGGLMSVDGPLYYLNDATAEHFGLLLRDAAKEARDVKVPA